MTNINMETTIYLGFGGGAAWFVMQEPSSKSWIAIAKGGLRLICARTIDDLNAQLAAL
jgi:hypothetical protein